MKYHVRVNGEEHEVVLTESLGELSVVFDGAPLDVRFEEVDRLGQAALYLGEKSFAISIEGDAAAALVTVAGHAYEVEIEDERERAAHQAEREHGRHGGDVASVMPGVVVGVLVGEGDAVAAGAPLVILEAMKMQNEIPAPFAGTVAKLHVAEGQAVAAGTRLVTLLPAE